MDPDVQMEIPAVREMVKKFDTVSDVLAQVSKVLENLANVLKTTAFIGLVGGYALLHYIEVIKPQIQELAQKCAEISQDLAASVDAFERGDAQGATRFY